LHALRKFCPPSLSQLFRLKVATLIEQTHIVTLCTKMITNLALTFLALFSIAYTADGQDANCSTITEIICGQNEGFGKISFHICVIFAQQSKPHRHFFFLTLVDILCELIETTGLSDDLSTDLWTMFIPTDEAFQALPESLMETLMEDDDALLDVLLFHAIPGDTINSTQLVCGGIVEMANGDESR